MAKLRVDQLLLDRGLVESRTRAQALILAGKVYSGDRRVDKPGTPWMCAGKTIPGFPAAGSSSPMP